MLPTFCRPGTVLDIEDELATNKSKVDHVLYSDAHRGNRAKVNEGE